MNEISKMGNYHLEDLDELLDAIRDGLLTGNTIQATETIRHLYDPEISQIYITLFQEYRKPLRWGSRKRSLEDTLQRIVLKLRDNSRLAEFAVHDCKQCRIMFEMVIKESPCTIRNLTTLRVSINRFEAGVNGLKYKYQGVTRFFMPTDAITQSIMSVNQLLNYLSKKTGIAKQTNKISERVHLMRREPIEYTFVESMAYISYQDKTIPLYRGYPVPETFNRNIMYESMIKSIDWLVDNMNEDGSFLYFYDGTNDTKVDLDHPKMTDPLYNNILRHSGGTVSLLRGYELTEKSTYLDAAKKSIDFFLTTFQEHKHEGQYACYPFYNKKSKLGGAGIGLVAMMHYYIHTEDEYYRKQLDGLTRHILSRVDDEGEMLGYYIHPRFYDGQPIINPPDVVKKELFSFYYPGEALLGLALYYQYIKNIDPQLKSEIYQQSLKALDFLVDVRPVKYDYLFDALPADAWLMQAIEEWVKIDGFKKQSYIDFVFNDTQAMFDHMYTEENAIAPDYVGGFFYNYGDHVYHDASRNEGVIAAYNLAKYLGEEDRANYIMENMLKSAKGLMHTLHTPESTYAHKYPQKSINSFRFKLTRQWVRVDSVQHAACFFARLSMTEFSSFLEHNEEYLPVLGNYKIVGLIASSGYGNVYKAKKLEETGVCYAVKKIKQSRYINLIEKEARILIQLNAYKASNRLGLQDMFWYGGSIHFVFDYLSGGNLKNHIEKYGPANESDAIKMLLDMLNVLKFIREKNILHLDIKLANILLDKKGNYFLSDWGLAEEGDCVDTLHIKGNPLYLAPEMYAGKRCFASEIYSLGATLYYMLMRKPIFNLRKRYSLAQKVYSHCYFEPEQTSDLSEKMHYLITRMMDKNPSSRATIEEVEQIIQDKISWQNIKPVKNESIDFDDEITTWNLLANNGIVYAMYKMGEYYHRSGDINQAIEWHEKAAEKGLASSECELALLYALDKREPELVLELLKRAASKGLDMAQYQLGLVLENEKLGQLENNTADKWFIAAAKNAYRPAYTKLKEKNIVIHADVNSCLKE